jgi:hypothetical protein
VSTNSSRILCVLVLLAILQAACFLPSVVPATSQPPADGTAVMQTALAQIAATLTQAALQGQPPPIQPPPPQQPQATPTNTPLPTLTPTATLTPTPEGAWISVSTETKCRLGPGKAYDQVGGLVADRMVQVFGKDPSGQYYYIRNPNDPASFCWVWAYYATPQGSFAAVPVYTPPASPTPAPGFTVAYLGVTTCAPQFAFSFAINNTGGATWESIRIVVTDNTTATSTTHILDSFRSYNGCALEMTQDDLMPGESGNVSNVNAGQLNYNPAGHSMMAAFTLCTQNGLGGTCLSKTINFTP